MIELCIREGRGILVKGELRKGGKGGGISLMNYFLFKENKGLNKKLGIGTLTEGWLRKKGGAGGFINSGIWL